MKKIVIILAMLLIAFNSFNQTSRQTSNSERPTQRREQDRDAKGSSAQPDNLQEKRTPENTRRNNDNERRENMQPARNNGNPASGRSTRTDNNDRSKRATSPNQPSNVNRTYEARSVTREYASPRIDRERHRAIHPYDRPPVRREFREHQYVYRAPVQLNVFWSNSMYNHYIRMYPMVKFWNYPIGYRIVSIPAYNADYYKGQVMTVYGQINEIYYSRETDEYFLYIGPYYPYQDFTIVMPGWIARQFSNRPSVFFDNQNLAVTGLITTFEGEPEIVLKESFQINLY